MIEPSLQRTKSSSPSRYSKSAKPRRKLRLNASKRLLRKRRYDIAPRNYEIATMMSPTSVVKETSRKTMKFS